MRSLGARAVLTVAVLAVLTSCACQVAPRNVRVSPGKVLVVGDSLVVEAKAVIEARVPGARVVARTGAAPCSLLPARSQRRSADVVVLAFSGNDSFWRRACRVLITGSVAYRDSYGRTSSHRYVEARMALAVWDASGRRTACRRHRRAWAAARVPVVDAAIGLGGDRYVAGADDNR